MISEAQLADRVHDLAVRCGWRTAHFRTSQNSHGEHSTAVQYEGAGFPDLVLVHPKRHLVLFRELKSSRGSTTDAQVHWLNDLTAAHADAAVWRPSDWFQIMHLLSDGRAKE